MHLRYNNISSIVISQQYLRNRERRNLTHSFNCQDTQREKKKREKLSRKGERIFVRKGTGLVVLLQYQTSEDG